jgi:hypothetical protein
MKMNRTIHGFIYLFGAYIQFFLFTWAFTMPVFIKNIYIALLFSIYSTVIFALLRKRSKRTLYLVGGIQFILWTSLNFCQIPVVDVFLLFLSMFLVFGLSAKGLMVLFSGKLDSNHA